MTLVAGLATTTVLAAACGGGGATSQVQPSQTTAPAVTQPAPAPTTTTTVPPGVTMANYNAIQNGMTLADVEKLLGPNQTGGTPSQAAPGETLYNWYANGPGTEPYVSVYFGSNGLVTSKAQTGLH